LLHARSDLQELALAPVFTEFPRRIKDWQYEIEDANARMGDAFDEKIEKYEQRLASLTNRISPLRLAARLNAKKMRLALLRQQQSAAIKKAVDAKDERLKIGMASLDALSPLAVLNRGYSIVQNERGIILRDAENAKPDERVKIRLARGTIEAQVLAKER